jgi:hypothetical protein
VVEKAVPVHPAYRAILPVPWRDPDVIVAAIMGGLGLWGGWQIVSQARGELRSKHLPQAVMAGE